MEPLIRSVLAQRALAAYHLGPTSVCLLAYADDLLLIARDSGSLRALIHIVKQSPDWCGLRFNAKKCASLHLDFRGGRQGVRDTAFSIQGGDMRQLGEEASYKYLGSPWCQGRRPTG
ncbi:uncharacterized protein [Hetaerina americana]|uniref:uncharacterized protein n=1 Tax=Hetaerina americana TaxID=62018 RepID=UPI003A7F3DF6